METIKPQQATTAAKDHVCSFCGMKIVKGDSYLKSTHVNDGYIYDWKAHEHCESIAIKLKMYEACDNFLTEEDFRIMISEEYGDIMKRLLQDSGVASNFDVIMQQFDCVIFRQKLGHVIRHHKKATT